MKTFICFICAIITTTALAALPQVQYAGVTYEVEVVRDNGKVSKECITFNESGRYTISGETLTMLWAPQVELPDQFMAVTAPGERTVVPYHQGVYGAVLPDRTLKGNGIDQDGSTFEFHGRSNDDCYTNLSAQAERNAISNLGNLVRFPDPCLMANDSGTSCNPVPDPLRALVLDLGNLIRFSDHCLMADDSGVTCVPITDPLRALVVDLGNLIRFSDHCLTADDSGASCDAITDPLRGFVLDLGNLIHLSNHCLTADDSGAACDSITYPPRGFVLDLGNLIHLSNHCLTADDSGAACDSITDRLRGFVLDLGNLIHLSNHCLTADDSGAACDSITDPLRASDSDSDLGNLIRFPDPCPDSNDTGSNCNPIPDPLRSDTNNVAQSSLAGHSFRLTLGTSDRTVVEYCWTFGEKGQIETANGDWLTRSPTNDSEYKAGFRSVGAGSNGRGMAYHGKLVGDNLLEVVGIEALDGNSVATYGFGQQVGTCQ